MKDICDNSKCTGCMACFNICKKNAIMIKEDAYGFMHPVILEDLCIRCGQCYCVCPHNKNVIRDSLDVTECLAGWSENSEQRAKSSSGGIFAAVAASIIKSGGVVFGAAFEKDYIVNHIMIERLQDIPLLQGSKYLQSQIGNTFTQCAEMLCEGRKVLFTGTPCQIDGLYAFLGNKRTENLFTIDIICHGVPSYKTFRFYLDSAEKTYNSKVKEFSFRNKKTVRGWEHSCTIEMTLENGKEVAGYKEDMYFWNGFLKNIFLRECCYNCEYAGKKRVGDISIGDFWGIQNISKKEKMLGISLVLCNSNRGRELLTSADIVVEHRTIKEAIPMNQTLERPFTEGKGREKFFRDMEISGFRKAVENNDSQRMRYLKLRASIRDLIGDENYQKLKTVLHK